MNALKVGLFALACFTVSPAHAIAVLTAKDVTDFCYASNQNRDQREPCVDYLIRQQNLIVVEEQVLRLFWRNFQALILEMVRDRPPKLDIAFEPRMVIEACKLMDKDVVDCFVAMIHKGEVTIVTSAILDVDFAGNLSRTIQEAKRKQSSR